jgi:hypothetical protein
MGTVFLVDGVTRPARVTDAITLTSGGSSDGFGWGLDAGDANGDGLADLAVVVALPRRVPLPRTVTADQDATASQASWRDPFFLEDVDIVGDMDGDAVSELVVSSPVRGGHIAGAVYVVPAIRRATPRWRATRPASTTATH